MVTSNIICQLICSGNTVTKLGQCFHLSLGWCCMFFCRGSQLISGQRGEGESDNPFDRMINPLLGLDSLLNDLFLGENGHFVYEEMFGGARGEVDGRLDGFLDAILKVFGL